MEILLWAWSFAWYSSVGNVHKLHNKLLLVLHCFQRLAGFPADSGISIVSEFPAPVSNSSLNYNFSVVFVVELPLLFSLRISYHLVKMYVFLQPFSESLWITSHPFTEALLPLLSSSIISTTPSLLALPFSVLECIYLKNNQNNPPLFLVPVWLSSNTTTTWPYSLAWLQSHF